MKVVNEVGVLLIRAISVEINSYKNRKSSEICDSRGLFYLYYFN